MSDQPVRASRRHWLRISIRSLIILVLVAGGWLGWLVRSARIQREAFEAEENRSRLHQEAVEAEENRRISEWMASRAITSQPGPLNMVGNLASGRYWTQVLPLTEEQRVVITRLDKLARRSHYLSLMADAEPFDGPPTVRRRLLAQNVKRRREAIHHAQRLVALGFLTEAQAAFVTERYLKSVGIGALNNDAVGVAEQLGLTESQRGELAEVNARFLQRSYAKIPEAMSPDRAYSEWVSTWSRRYEEALRDVLTASQRDRWSDLASRRSLPAEPPNTTRSALSKAEAASVRMEDLSPVFRALAEKASDCGLSAEQESLVKDLEELTRVGYAWIGRHDAEDESQPADARANQAERVSQVRAEFLQHAEDLALLGILTRRQADQLLAAIQKSGMGLADPAQADSASKP